MFSGMIVSVLSFRAKRGHGFPRTKNIFCEFLFSVPEKANSRSLEVVVYHLVFVCTGNLCRSPMAEAVLRRRWMQMGRNDLHVSSSGIHAKKDQAPPEMVIEVCRDEGLDLSAHLSRPLDPRELQGADLVLTMEPAQEHFLKIFFPRIADRVGLLAAWGTEGEKRQSIPDPMGGKRKAFQKTCDRITFHIERILPFLLDRFS